MQMKDVLQRLLAARQIVESLIQAIVLEILQKILPRHPEGHAAAAHNCSMSLLSNHVIHQVTKIVLDIIHKNRSSDGTHNGSFDPAHLVLYDALGSVTNDIVVAQQHRYAIVVLRRMHEFHTLSTHRNQTMFT